MQTIRHRKRTTHNKGTSLVISTMNHLFKKKKDCILGNNGNLKHVPLKIKLCSTKEQFSLKKKTK